MELLHVVPSLEEVYTHVLLAVELVDVLDVVVDAVKSVGVVQPVDAVELQQGQVQEQKPEQVLQEPEQKPEQVLVQKPELVQEPELEQYKVLIKLLMIPYHTDVNACMNSIYT